MNCYHCQFCQFERHCPDIDPKNAWSHDFSCFYKNESIMVRKGKKQPFFQFINPLSRFGHL